VSESDPKIIFLHIPKTAGQSVHAALENAYGKEAVCPARVNDQLRRYSVRELNQYKVFSGHLDWSMLDCIQGPRYVFTILREPMDRILSFYFFLRDQAEKLSPEARNRPQHQGLRAAFDCTPREYFLGGAPHLRRFLDDHYDNFYTYFFAGRHYASRGEMVGLMNRGELTSERVLEMAEDNMARLDQVFTVDNMGDVFAMIRRLSGKEIMSDEKYRVNVNTTVAAGQRLDKLKGLGADPQTMARLAEYCRLDNQLWARYAAASQPAAVGAEA
jgi:hypothetical protein